MKNRRRLILAAVIAGLTAAWAGIALAASPELTLCWQTEGKEISIRLVKNEKEKASYTLYLPGAMKNRDPEIRVSGDDGLIWDGTAYPNGSLLPVSEYIGKKANASFMGGRSLGNVQVLRGSAIPSLYFTVTANDLKRLAANRDRDIKEAAEVVIVDGDGGLNAAESLTSFKYRGNSTYFASKKAYTFQTEKKINPSGMGKNRKWILLANWFDISLIRNQITLDLCRELGLTSTPDCAQADVYLNGLYNGTYLLTEKIQLKKNRLEITDLEESYEALNGKEAYEKAKVRRATSKVAVKIMRYARQKQEPEDVTGGYLLEIEKALQFSRMTDTPGFVTDGEMCVIIKEPTYIGKRGVLYIAKLVNDFHNAVLAADGVNPETGKYYGDYIDMRSFAAKVAVEEFCANYDVRAASHFMYKDSDRVDPLLYCGPGWDYDLTYGNKDDGMKNPARIDYVYDRSTSTSFLYHWLLTHEDFRKLTRQIVEEQMLPAAEILLGEREPGAGSGMKSIDRYRAEIAASAEMNFTRWNARGVKDITDESGRTFDSAGAYLKNWIAVRTEALRAGWLQE